jgi:hypothetical protein
MADKEEIAKWHRWFAAECNNLGWSLAAKNERSDAENREMLFAANAAAFHWAKVGQPINDARADLLIAHVYATLGNGAEAMHYATRCLNMCLKQPCEDWDVAFAHAGVAFAASVLGDGALHAEHYATAERLGRAIKDEEDRRVFLEEFAHIPKPQ